MESLEGVPHEATWARGLLTPLADLISSQMIGSQVKPGTGESGELELARQLHHLIQGDWFSTMQGPLLGVSTDRPLE